MGSLKVILKRPLWFYCVREVSTGILKTLQRLFSFRLRKKAYFPITSFPTCTQVLRMIELSTLHTISITLDYKTE